MDILRFSRGKNLQFPYTVVLNIYPLPLQYYNTLITAPYCIDNVKNC